MTARYADMNASAIRTRLDHADSCLKVAGLVRDFGDIEDITAPANVIGALAVMAGIAASDVICGHRLGHRANGENHVEAIALLRAAAPGTAHPSQLA